MKVKLLFLSAIVIISACSSPKYAYKFDYYNYNSGKKGESTSVASVSKTRIDDHQEDQLIASSNQSMVVDAGSSEVPALTPIAADQVRKTYMQMTKDERKVLRENIKDYVKAKKDSIKAAKSTNAMDNDLKLAAIFGAVGLVALIIGGDVFWIIGGIAMLIGVVFFVKWLVRQ